MALTDYLPRLSWGSRTGPTADQAIVTRPPEGQKAKLAGYGASFGAGYVSVPFAPYPDGSLGRCGWTWRGTYDVYAEMDRNPTLALSKFAVASKVRGADWQFQPADGVPDSVRDWVRDTLMPWRTMLLGGQIDALSYGWTPVEPVWGPVRNQWGKGLPAMLWAPTRFVELPRFSTTCLEDEDGNYVGLRIAEGDLIGPAAIRFVNEPNGLHRLYGRSRHENAREFAWSPWVNTARHLGRIGDKVSGTHVFITFPPEESTTQPDGTVVDNLTIAKAIATDLAAGKNVVIQQSQFAFTVDDFRADPNLLKVAGFTGWQVQFVDAGDAAKAQGGTLEVQKHYERLMARAWHQPERSLFEAETGGSRADSESHTEIPVADADLVHQDALQTINGLVGAMLYFNRGAGHERDIEVVASPVVDKRKQLMKEILVTSLSDPGFKRAYWEAVDQTAIADELGIPYKGDSFELEIAPEEPAKLPGAPAGAGRMNGKPVGAN